MKNFNYDHFPSGKWRKTLLFMSLKLVVLLCSVGMLAASPSFSQQKKLDVSYKSVSLESMFKDIEKQTGYRFLYFKDAIPANITVTISQKDVTVEELLNEVLPKHRLKYSMDDDVIMVSPAETPSAQQAQSAPLTGTVRDGEGRPLVGVSVAVRGSTRGTTTGADGMYSITAQAGDVIVFSFIGKKPVEVAYSGQQRLDISLEESSSFINEVVVQGYGTTTVREATGSVSRLNAREIERSPMNSSVQSLLQGRAVGVNVQIQSASPTSPVNVLIRGVSTLTSNTQPLWVIDGVPDYSTNTSGDIANSLYNLNISDIESIDILKDASATAIYGSRAANGVVIVTTKRGRMGQKQTIEVSARYGVQSVASAGPRAMNAAEYERFMTRIISQDIYRGGAFPSNNTSYTAFYDVNEFNKLGTSQWDASDLKLKTGAFLGGDTDWWDEMTQLASSQQYNFSVRGGNVSSNHFFSLSYSDQDGVVKGGRSQLFSGRLNFETMIFDSNVKLGLNASGSVRKAENKDHMLTKLMTFRPDQPAYNPDGSINLVLSETTVESPLLTLRNRNDGRNMTLSITPSLEWEITEGLILRTRGTVDYINTNEDVFYRKGTQGYSASINSRTLTNYQNTTYAWENSLDFVKTIDRHSVTAMLAQSIEKYDSRYMMGYGNQFPDEEILINVGSGATTDADSDRQQNAVASFIGRLNYKYDDRYLATVTFRADGSSRFGSDKRWGYFPSAAVAWVISEEEFIQPVKNIIPYLKLRGSVGVSGSQNLGNHDYVSLYGSGTYDGKSGIRPTTLGNNALQWEETTSFDLGLDYGLLNERIRGSIGYYSREISNLIYNGAVPANSSQSQVNQNIGVIANKGWEFDIRIEAIRKQDMGLEFGFNLATNKGKVKKLDGINTELMIPYYYEYVRLAEGSPVGDWYGYKWAGRQYQSQEELYGLKFINTTTGVVSDYRNSSDYEGSLYLMDTNGDGRVTKDDRTVLGNFNPKFFGGFNINFHYKNLYASALFSYSYGAKRLWHYQYSAVTNGVGIRNNYTEVLDSYNFNGSQSATFPTLSSAYNAMTYISDYFLHDASYIRLNALNVSYRLPARWLQNTFISSIEVTGSATNLFTITKYPGFDPQGNFSTSDSSNGAGDITTVGYGEDRSLYPAARTYSIGIKVSLK